MEEMQGCKRQRGYSFEPSMAVLANFSHKYVAYLLPALLKVGTSRSCRGSKDDETEKIVRFEVDMALVLSASGFAWSRALKRKLEQAMNINKLCSSPASPLVCSSLTFTYKQRNALNLIINELCTSPLITRPLPPIGSLMNAKPKPSMCKTMKPKRYRWTLSSKRMLARGDEELRCGVRTLRRILPGGSEMGLCELLSEVESYVVCLELQVSILRSLLSA